MLTHFSNTFEYLCDLYIFKKDKTLNEQMNRPTDIFTENRKLKKVLKQRSIQRFGDLKKNIYCFFKKFKWSTFINTKIK